MTGIAVVGTGMWAPRLAAAAERAGLELVACFSRDEPRCAEFRGCIRGEALPETGADEGIAALAIVLQALEAHAEAVS